MAVGEQELRAFLMGRLALLCGLDVDEVDPDRLIEQYGVASRDAVAMTGELAEFLDRPLRPESLWRYPTINQMVRGLIRDGLEIAVVGFARRAGRADGYDAEFFRTTPDADLAEVSWDALENAGLAPRSLDRVEAFVDASPLVAAHEAMQSLRAGKADVALATAVGDGRAVVVLKRLPDAERDGNRVIAQLSGSAPDGLPAACADAGIMQTEIESVQTAEAFDALLETIAKGNKLTAVTDDTNTHVILRRAQQSLANQPLQRVGHFLLSDITLDRIRDYAATLADHLAPADEAPADVALADVARTLAGRLGRGPVRAAVVARDRGELVDGLRALAENHDHPAVVAGEVNHLRMNPVWVFPGDKPKWTSLRSLVEAEPEFAATVNDLDPLLRWSCGLPFQDAVITGTRPDERQLKSALYGVQVALALLWRQYGVTPAAIVGTATGEIAGAVLAGALTVTEGARVVAGQTAQRRAPQLPFFTSTTAAARAGHRVFTEISLHPQQTDELEADLVTSTLRQDQDPLIAFHCQLATLEVHGLPLTPRPGRITNLPPAPWHRR